MTGDEMPQMPEDAAEFVDDALADKPELIVYTADLPATARALRDLLATSGYLFDRDMPVKVVQPASGGAMIATRLTISSVVVEVHRLCQPVKIDSSGNRVPVTLPDRVARMYLDMVGEWNLPPLVGISTAPILVADGSISDAVGFDPATGLWCCKVPPLELPQRPRHEDAVAALLLLRDAFKTFPFADAVRCLHQDLGVEVVDLSHPPGRDESAFLTALLTALCRACLWLAPGFLIVAPAVSGAGSGKGLLVRAICAITFGIRPRAFTAGHDRQELDKRIGAELVEAAPCLFLDNVNGAVLRSDILAAVLTERPIRVRVFGETRMVELNSTAFVAVTGNGLTVSEDLARRFILCELDAKCEDPETRRFASGFLEQIEARRPELLSAALTILRWARQNSSSLVRGRPLGSFEHWCEWVRDPLLTLGCADPVERIETLKANDPRRQRIAELYEAWWHEHGDNPVKAADLADAVRILIDPQGRGRQFIQSYLGQLAGTRAAGFVLHRQQPVGKWGAATYSLKRTSAEAGDGKEHREHRGHRGAADRETEPESPMPPMPNAAGQGETTADRASKPKTPMPPMPDAVGEAEQPADQSKNADPDHPPPESEGQELPMRPRQGMTETQEADGNPILSPVSVRPFVYRRRTREDVLNRIRMYEERYPGRARRFAGDPEADFVDADEEGY
jgi:hypothetical protein